MVPLKHSAIWPELHLPTRKMLEHCHIAPHAFVRSALFSAHKFPGNAIRMEASATSPITIPAPTDYTLRQVEGVRLDQGDFEVYIWLLALVYRHELAGTNSDARLSFTREEAMAALGRTRGTNNFEWLKASLTRLSRAEIAYAIRYAQGQTRLVEVMAWGDGKNHDYEVVIPVAVGDFLREQDFKMLPAAQLAALKDYLAKWLYAFYSSHKQSYDMLTDTIKQWADREGIQESKWRTALKNALAEVKDITGWRTCETQDAGKSAKVVVRKGSANRPLMP